MKPIRKRRLYMVLGIIGGVAIAAGFGLQAFKGSIGYKDPTAVLAGAVMPGKRFQIGGMVKPGSVVRTPGSLEIRFVVTDFQSDVPAKYTGVLPDLFKENSGVWAFGRLGNDGVFVADEVVARHDENYMPPAVAKSLKRGESRLDSPPQRTSPQYN
ncbi:MAG: cytochrome c maturation protein CcmE [Steroidobacteraceae bacterium]